MVQEMVCRAPWYIVLVGETIPLLCACFVAAWRVGYHCKRPMLSPDVQLHR